MDILKVGSKYDIHMWQHNKIMEYYDLNMEFPPLNKNGW